MRAPAAVRFEAKIDRSDGPDACHPWTAALFPDGYPKFKAEVDGRWESVRGHQWLWEQTHGPIPLDPSLGRKLDVDHLCHNVAAERGECAGGRACAHRVCCNVLHLRIVEIGANLRSSSTSVASVNAAKTHCPAGHPYSGANLYLYPDGRRACRTCREGAKKRYQDRRFVLLGHGPLTPLGS